MAIGPDDRVRTAAGSRVLIVFTDGSRLRIGENAEVAIDHYSYQPSSGRGRALINFLKGAFRFGKTANLDMRGEGGVSYGPPRRITRRKPVFIPRARSGSGRKSVTIGVGF